MSTGLPATTNNPKVQKLFTRRTMITETAEGLQASNIQVYMYDDEQIAYEFYKEQVTFSKWEEALRNGECFFTVARSDGGLNTIFLEVRYVFC